MQLLHPERLPKGQLLEANDNLRRMLAAIPLTEDERAAVDDGQGAPDKLLGRLADIPTTCRADAATDRQPHDRNMPSDRSHHLATTVIFPGARSPLLHPQQTDHDCGKHFAAVRSRCP